MSPLQPNGNEATQMSNRSRGVSPVSMICTRCIDGCPSHCEVFKASFRGREVIHPSAVATLTAGGGKEYSVDYSHLNIAGCSHAAEGLPGGKKANPDNRLSPTVDTETQYGVSHKVKMRLPIFAGALGSTEIARKSWEHFATGAAIAGVAIVCGENVCGIDPGLELDPSGKVSKSPNMAERVEQYHRYHEGYGDMIVQMSVEDTRLGVPEYVVGQLGVECIELAWGQSANGIGGEIQVDTLERALELKRRGCVVTPDPSNEANQTAFRDGALKHFVRHARLGFVDHDGFMKEVERLRKLGAKRVTLRTGVYPMRELALAIKWASQAGLDLLTIDGTAGGTGLSPWRMMQEWGVPTFHLQAMTQELCRKLAARGEFVPDIAIAGGFSSEDHIFKVLALGSPFTKAVCMDRALMIPGMVGKNIGLWLKDGGEALPRTVSDYGHTVEEIFVWYEDLVAKYGKDTVKSLPLGAVAFYTLADKLKVGLQQLMAGSRNFRVSTISRRDLMALTPEAAQVSGIPYIMDACREEAENIITS